MTLLEETFREADPEGFLNIAYIETETKELANGKSEFISKDGNGKNPLDAIFVEAQNKKVKKQSATLIPYWKLFRFATRYEVFLIFVAILCAFIASLGLPYGLIIYGEFTTLLGDREVRHRTSTKTYLLNLFGGGRVLVNATVEESYDETLKDSQAYGIGCLVGAILRLTFAALSIDILNRTAQKQISKVRKLFLQSVLRQDMTWYDLNTSESFAVRMTDDLDKLKEGIGEKLSIFIYLFMSFVISVIFSLSYGWKLTLLMLSCAPLIIISTAFVTKMQSSLTQKELKSYSKAGAIAEEVLGSIRTVIAFGGEKKELERYTNRLFPAEKNGKKKGIYSGIGGGFLWFVIYCCFAVAFWFGISLILEDRDKIDKDYTPAVLVIVLYSILAGAENYGLAAPLFEAFSTAQGSAVSIFSVIDRIPEIDSLGEFGKKPRKISGNIKFNNVTFRYPARNDVQVLDGLNLEIEAGKMVALVGPSGCGKSTCLQLIQHLYNPTSGSVSVDGIKIPDWNTLHLRSFIGVVGQEPVLFATTIRENIRYGNPDVSDDEVENAARIANCHQFIMILPDGYETKIGERGAQLSGGQKQRISIARAVVKNPKILLLDEATSALDPTSEKRVQVALERASRGRTTLVVSHRLSTITNSDKIVYINKSVVVEQGTHAELMTKEGSYFNLVQANNSTIAAKDSTTHRPKGNSKAKLRDLVKSSIKFKSDSSSKDEANSNVHIKSTEEEITQEDKKKVSMLSLMKMNKNEWPYILTGTIASCIVGASFSAFAILLGEMYGILSLDDPEEIKMKASSYSLFFLVLGVSIGISTFIQTYMFKIAGVKLTSRLRSMTFDAMMRQEMGWFDDARNAVGALCARLAGDCADVQGATGNVIGTFVQAGAVLFIGIGISFYYNWKMALVASISIPIVLISTLMEARFVENSNMKEKLAMENATKMAVEAIGNIRTVASLGQEPHVLKRYVNKIDQIDEYCKEKSRYRGFVFGLGQSVPMICYALSLWFGGTLIAKREMPYENAIKVSEAMIFGSWMLGQALIYAPNVNAGVVSASRILKLLSRVPAQNNPEPSPSKDYESDEKIIYKDVDFRYPTRKGVQVLGSLNLEIEKGTTVALVGPSGCGKSTCMQLLIRYYDPDAGQVNIDETPTVDFPLSRIRAKLGLVSQEPILFDRTIAENIAYGDNERDTPMVEIIEAAKSANIHDFITKLPKGYETGLGSKGANLSGGQKQRIAIARALVRNPKILLLDEATSALDTQSENIVQAALDKARTGRTCITIAHRLTTIQNSDIIYLLENGDVVEKGSHDELMNKGEKYSKLYKMQQVN